MFNLDNAALAEVVTSEPLILVALSQAGPPSKRAEVIIANELYVLFSSSSTGSAAISMPACHVSVRPRQPPTPNNTYSTPVIHAGCFRRLELPTIITSYPTDTTFLRILCPRLTLTRNVNFADQRSCSARRLRTPHGTMSRCPPRVPRLLLRSVTFSLHPGQLEPATEDCDWIINQNARRSVTAWGWILDHTVRRVRSTTLGNLLLNQFRDSGPPGLQVSAHTRHRGPWLPTSPAPHPPLAAQKCRRRIIGNTRGWQNQLPRPLLSWLPTVRSATRKHCVRWRLFRLRVEHLVPVASTRETWEASGTWHAFRGSSGGHSGRVV